VDEINTKISFNDQVQEGKLKQIGLHAFKATNIKNVGMGSLMHMEKNIGMGSLMHMEPFTHDAYKEAYIEDKDSRKVYQQL